MRKRVPTRFTHVAARKEVWKSLASKTQRRAEKEGAEFWNDLIKHWELLAYYQSKDANSATTYLEDYEIARSHKFRYLKIEDVAKLPLDQLNARMDAIPSSEDGSPNMPLAAVLLGASKNVNLPLSHVLELFAMLKRSRMSKLTATEQQRYMTPKKKAMRDFIAFAGDISFEEIGQDLTLDYQLEMLKVSDARSLQSGIIGTYFDHLSSVLGAIQNRKLFPNSFDMKVLRIERGHPRRRPPFSTRWIKDNILNPSILSQLSPELRALLVALINSGLRVSEATKLQAIDIRLDG